MSEYFPPGYVGTEIAILDIAIASDEELWKFEVVPGPERAIWLGLNTAFNGFAFDVVLSENLNANLNDGTRRRIRSFEQSELKLRHALHAGRLTAFFLEQDGRLASFASNVWGQEEAEEALLSGRAYFKSQQANQPNENRRILLYRVRVAQLLCGRGGLAPSPSAREATAGNVPAADAAPSKGRNRRMARKFFESRSVEVPWPNIKSDWESVKAIEGCEDLKRDEVEEIRNEVAKDRGATFRPRGRPPQKAEEKMPKK